MRHGKRDLGLGEAAISETSGTPVLLPAPETHLPPFLQCLPCPFLLLTTSCRPPPTGVHQESTKAILVSCHPVPTWGYNSFLSLLVPWLPQKPAPGHAPWAQSEAPRGSSEQRKGGRGLGSREPPYPHPHAFPLPWKGRLELSHQARNG